jgi:ketosteroid isomerase-like protein
MSAVLKDADDVAAKLQVLLDRQGIEDLFVGYYSGLGGGQPDWFGQFFVEGAELDVNGLVARGRDEIADLYRRVAEDKPNLTGTFRMMLTNLRVEVNGDAAKAAMLWTQTLNESVKGPPRLIEQGREFDALVRQNGSWRIAKRVVIADSGLPDLMDETYRPRADYSLSSIDSE